mmetsp:Transcript_27876/g.30981  ORF Transcript_27876/g.30981 Transcript_27876/m.30981 type:complete len:80 (+) Transcript_27876:503-742(+)
MGLSEFWCDVIKTCQLFFFSVLFCGFFTCLFLFLMYHYGFIVMKLKFYFSSRDAPPALPERKKKKPARRKHSRNLSNVQ